jgi:magnesium chelatase subunit I
VRERLLSGLGTLPLPVVRLHPAMGQEALDGATAVDRRHLKAVAPMALSHRLRRDPLDEAGSGSRVARIVAEVLP